MSQVCVYFSAPIEGPEMWRVSCLVLSLGCLLFSLPVLLTPENSYRSTVCYKEGRIQAGEAAQQVRVLVQKLGDPRWNPGTHIIGKETSLHKVVFWPPPAFYHIHTHEHTQVLKGDGPRILSCVCVVFIEHSFIVSGLIEQLKRESIHLPNSKDNL